MAGGQEMFSSTVEGFRYHMAVLAKYPLIFFSACESVCVQDAIMRFPYVNDNSCPFVWHLTFRTLTIENECSNVQNVFLSFVIQLLSYSRHSQVCLEV